VPLDKHWRGRATALRDLWKNHRARRQLRRCAGSSVHVPDQADGLDKFPVIC
jgi:hypothetical protein